MPDLLNRHSHEERFAYGLASELSRERRKLVVYGVERLDSRPAVEWERDQEELAAILLMLLRDPWYSSYYGLAGGEGVIARADDIERAYQRWAGGYATETAKQITDNTKELALATALLIVSAEPVPFGAGAVAAGATTTAAMATAPRPSSILPGGGRINTLPFPQANLFDVAGDQRIIRGSISMVTDAASAGEFAVAAEFEKQEAARVAAQQAAADGAAAGTTNPLVTGGGDGNSTKVLPPRKLVAYWHTEADGKVCKICRPLDGQPESVWRSRFPSGPKAHVACRCYLDWRVE